MAKKKYMKKKGKRYDAAMPARLAAQMAKAGVKTTERVTKAAMGRRKKR